MSEHTERIAKALLHTMVMQGGATGVILDFDALEALSTEILAPLVEAAIEAALEEVVFDKRLSTSTTRHERCKNVGWAAALSVLEGKEKQ